MSSAAKLPQHRRLVRLGDLDDKHVGRMVAVGGLVGTLVGVITVGDRVQLALIVGQSRAWTDALDSGEGVEVWKP